MNQSNLRPSSVRHTKHCTYRTATGAENVSLGADAPTNITKSMHRSTLPTEACDYANLTEKGHEDRATPILVSRNDKTKLLSAEALPAKGTKQS